jgi:histidinol-phosphate phosphatase family protein
MPGVVPALRTLQHAGYALIVVSNQSAIGRGKASVEAVRSVNARLRQMLRAEGVELAGIFLCPHKPEAACDCRKPMPGLLLQARDQLGVDLAASWIVGDSTRDVGAGQAAGVRSILIETGWGGGDPAAGSGSSARTAPGLLKAAEIILAKH